MSRPRSGSPLVKNLFVLVWAQVLIQINWAAFTPGLAWLGLTLPPSTWQHMMLLQVSQSALLLQVPLVPQVPQVLPVPQVLQLLLVPQVLLVFLVLPVRPLESLPLRFSLQVKL